MIDTSSILITGYDPMSLSIEMPEVKFGEGAELGEGAEIGEEAIFYRHFRPVIFWKLQNWIGVGLERKLKNAFFKFDQMSKMIISSRREEIRRGKRSFIVEFC
ncbi:unnamed protein product [Microthlaspi erraticum]|uniref:Uncharacterized protein n=1 Tax=Microthlaspi erraticum TaxID=1685480 RepID=A0A6D2IZ29_9BRAS|nr:unnamed protein product [Microthlaspi erraticum]